jgi:tetratricopeptide (TPR) repeat protein
MPEQLPEHEQLQERLRRAEQERDRALRRSRWLSVGLAVSGLLVLALAGVGAWLWQRHVAAEEQRRDEAIGLLSRAEQLLRHKEWGEARTALTQAESRLGAAGHDDLRRRLLDAQTALRQGERERDLLARLDEARLRAASAGEGGFDRAGSDRLYAEAFRAYGLDVEKLGPAEAAERARTSGRGADLLDALDDWARLLRGIDPKRAQQLVAVAERLDPDPWRRRLRHAMTAGDVTEIKRLAGEPPAGLSSSGVVLLADALTMAGEKSRSLAVLRQAQARLPGDFWLAFELGLACDHSSPVSQEEAARYYTAALALRPDSPAVLINLGIALKQQGRLPEAVACFREALRLQPDYSWAHSNLGLTLKAQGQLPEAVAAFKEALRLKPDFPEAHHALGSVLADQGKLNEAIAAYRHALQLKPDSARVYLHLGVALLKLGKVPEAIAAFREALRLDPKLTDARDNLDRALKDGKPQ